MKVQDYFFCLLLFAVSCSPTPASVRSIPIDFDQLIEEQISELIQHRNTLEKEAEVDGIRSDSTLVPTEEIWKNELAIFRQLGIVNRPLYQGSYRQEGPLDDPRSNLKIQQYKSETSPLTILRIYYQERIGRVRRIEGTLRDTNQFYTNERKLTLDFDEANGRPLLTSYAIIGYQKVAMRDTVRFLMHARVNW